MFSFVKSLFVSTTPTENADGDETSSESSESESVEEVQQPSAEEKQQRRSLTTSTDRSNGRVSTTAVAVTPEEFDEQPLNNTLIGALYLIDGLDFECLLPRCEVDLDGRMLVFNSLEDTASPTIKPQMFRVDRICNLRQHLSDSFQFFIRDSKDTGEEFGVQFESERQALGFRQLIFNALLDTAQTIIQIECALAEYDTKNREFVLISKSASVILSERPSDHEMYFSIEEKDHNDNDDHCSDRLIERRLFVDNLSKEIQMWPSVQTNQVTFWGVHHRALGVDKSMFLLEMDPPTVGQQAIQAFFSYLATALQDRSFMMEKADEDEPSLPMDDGFDLGPMGDPQVHREWRHSTGSNHHHRPSAEAESDDDDESASEEYEHRYSTQPLYSTAQSADALVHRFMEVGSDRTFVCRGDQGSPRHFGRKKGTKLQMQVYKREEGDDGEERLENVGTVDGKKFVYKGEQFLPSKGLLHQQEKKLLVVPEHDVDGDVFLMDLSTEKVVQKWGADGTAIQTMFPTFKTGQASMDPTFLCANPRNVFMMDTRMNQNAKSTSISYATNPKLSVGATDDKGHIVMASRLGALRLYDGEANVKGDFKRAKTLLEATREPIIAVDVTKDGAWIVATTKTFLVVFCTKLAGTGKTGFETALGQKKPAPRYLMLSADDVVKYQITEIDFAPAKFDAEEDSIVTSTGNMAVVWDFPTVKRGKPIYSVRFADDAIKDVQITTDSESVVVAYPTAVGLFGTERKRLE